MGIIEWTFPLRFAVALALGFLVGLERESTKIEQQKLVFGGVRTHPLISLFGFGCGWLYQIGVTFMVPAGLLAMGALTSIAYLAKIKGERYGSTSEVSALLTFVTGALALLVDVWIAMALGVVNAILLSEKAMLETYVERLNKVEFLATLKFLLVTVIILPVLPNQEYTYFRLNPTRIWQMVILVSSIGFVGYFLSKKFGERVGLWLSGLLGGIVSSTALTLSVGRIAQKDPDRASSALQASLLASSVMYIRILVLIWVINFSFVPLLWWRLVLLALVGTALSIRINAKAPAPGGAMVSGLQNPFEIRPAMLFAVLFVFLSVATVLVKQTVGSAGILVLSALVGVSDIDPFILSVVQVPETGMQVVCSAIIVAMMSNTVAKAVYFSVLAPSARRSALWRYAVWTVIHVPFVLM
jgi:uncharacterized membrane protein (DUF4010 family)